jgi:type II secretory pathway pseudopilin PulG
MKPRTTRATSLIEVLVAFAILAVLALPTLSLLTTSHRQLAVSLLEIRARLWARQAISAYAGLSFDQLLEAAKYSDVRLPEVTTGPVGFPGTMTVNVTSADPERTVPRLLRIVVTVRWSSRGRAEAEGRSVLVLERLVTMPEYGLVQRLDLGTGGSM